MYIMQKKQSKTASTMIHGNTDDICKSCTLLSDIRLFREKNGILSIEVIPENGKIYKIVFDFLSTLLGRLYIIFYIGNKFANFCQN